MTKVTKDQRVPDVIRTVIGTKEVRYVFPPSVFNTLSDSDHLLTLSVGCGQTSSRRFHSILSRIFPLGDHSFSGACYATFSPSLDIIGSVMPGYHLQRNRSK